MLGLVLILDLTPLVHYKKPVALVFNATQDKLISKAIKFENFG